MNKKLTESLRKYYPLIIVMAFALYIFVPALIDTFTSKEVIGMSIFLLIFVAMIFTESFVGSRIKNEKKKFLWKFGFPVSIFSLIYLPVMISYGIKYGIEYPRIVKTSYVFFIPIILISLIPALIEAKIARPMIRFLLVLLCITLLFALPFIFEQLR